MENKSDRAEMFHHPEKLEAQIIRFQNNSKKWIAIVGVLNGRPYEIFSGEADDFWIPTWVEKGSILKIYPNGGSSRYDFQFVDRQNFIITVEGLSWSFNKEYWNYAKLISAMLVFDIPLPFIIHLFSNIDFKIDSINIWKDGVVKALKYFIPDGTAVFESTCPLCGQTDALIYKEGCILCKKCAYSKN